ncbi:MAG: ABC transporter permease subunit [Opitutae bacterium]|nr:ABC transporter permease subunit [Opitutae bacterium]
MKLRSLSPLLYLAGAAFLLTALLYAAAAFFRPDVVTPPPAPSPEAVAAVTQARQRAESIDSAHPPVVWREVDYRAGHDAAWWPRAEAPVLADLVREGKLPPVAERTGPEPVVLAGPDGIGRYGGTWSRLASSHSDIETITWRMSSSILVRWSPQGYPIVPHLAKSWEVSPDSRVFTFTLRQGLRWSDGHPVTARDFVYWYQREVLYFKIASRLLRAGATQGRIEQVDELRLRFVFDQPNPLFLERLASSVLGDESYENYITPAHYLEQYHPESGNQKLIAMTMAACKLASPLAVYKRAKLWSNPEHPRLWPWIYRTWKPNAPQVFVRNPYYCAVDPSGQQLPYLDRLVFEIRPASLIGQTAAMGHVAMQDRHIRYEDHVLLMSEAAKNGYAVYHWFPASRSLFTIFPVLNRRVDPAEPETRWKAQLLNDRRFRQALSLAINRRDIIDAEFNGQGVPSQIQPGPGSGYAYPRLAQSYVDFAPAEASRLLDALGLIGRDPEGFRTFPDGTRMLWFLNMTDYTGNGPAQFVVDDWARVGVRCQLRHRARPLYDAEKKGYQHDFEVWMGESEFNPLIGTRNFVPTYLESFYAPAFGLWYQGGGANGEARWPRPGAIEPPAGHPLRRNMALLDEIFATTDQARRRALLFRIFDTNAEEVWHISIATPPPQLVVVKNGFRNVPANAIFSAMYLTPGNTGIETYFWDAPLDSPAVVAETRRALQEVTPEPAAVMLAAGRDHDSLPLAGFVRALLIGAGLLALVLLALRHPFIGRRLLLMIPTLAVVSVVVFVIVQLPPGDFVNARILELQMSGSPASAQQIEDYRANFHLDEPMPQRYLRWVGLRWFATLDARDTGLLQGNLGLSMEHNRSVNQVIGDRLLLTVLVTVATILVTWAVALPLGVYSAVRQYSPGDYALTLLGFLGMSVPSFLLAVVCVYLANRWGGWRISGLFSPEFAAVRGWSWAKLVDLVQHLWIPIAVLGLGGMAGMIRVMRANLLDELKKPYVITARAKGLRPLRLLVKYPLRLALNPFVSSLGGLFPQLVSGGTIVALVLSLPMVGPVMLEALQTEDVYLAGSMLMVLSLLGAVGTLASDLLLLWLDPRIRLSRGRD